MDASECQGLILCKTRWRRLQKFPVVFWIPTARAYWALVTYRTPHSHLCRLISYYFFPANKSYFPFPPIIEASFLLQGFWRVCSRGLEFLCPRPSMGSPFRLVIQASAQLLPAQRGPPWHLKETLPIPAIPLPLFSFFHSTYLSWSESAFFLYSLTYCVSPQLELSTTGSFIFLTASSLITRKLFHREAICKKNVLKEFIRHSLCASHWAMSFAMCPINPALSNENII